MEGMYWDDFRRFIEDNKKSWRSFKYYRSKDGFENTISICDFSLPRRTGVQPNKYRLFNDNWLEHSYVCNTSYFEGWIPFRDAHYEWDDEKKEWVHKPARGIKSTVKILVDNGCLDLTPAVKEVLNARS